MIGMRPVRTVTRYLAHKLPNAGGAKRHARIINEVIQFRKFLLIGFISHAAPLSQDLHNQTSDQSFGSDGGGDQSIGPLTRPERGPLFGPATINFRGLVTVRKRSR